MQILGTIDPERGSGRRLEESVAFRHLLLSVLLLLELFLALSACVFQLSASGIIFRASPRAVQGDDGLQLLSPVQSHAREGWGNASQEDVIAQHPSGKQNLLLSQQKDAGA